jgi:hypothetical protein
MAELRLGPGVKGPVTIREQSIMSKTIAGLAGAACLLFVASTANAATLSGSSTQATGSATSSVILAHGIHTTCQRDKLGWHRSYPWRKACAPAAAPLALWMWRCADGHCGYWHKKENRWKDGWKKGDSKKGDWKDKGKGKDKHH